MDTPLDRHTQPGWKNIPGGRGPHRGIELATLPLLQKEFDIQLEVYRKSFMTDDSYFDAICPYPITCSVHETIEFKNLFVPRIQDWHNNVARHFNPIFDGIEKMGVIVMEFMEGWMTFDDAINPISGPLAGNTERQNFFHDMRAYEIDRLHAIGFKHNDYHGGNAMVSLDHKYLTTRQDNVQLGRVIIIDFGRTSRVTPAERVVFKQSGVISDMTYEDVGYKYAYGIGIQSGNRLSRKSVFNQYNQIRIKVRNQLKKYFDETFGHSEKYKIFKQLLGSMDDHPREPIYRRRAEQAEREQEQQRIDKLHKTFDLYDLDKSGDFNEEEFTNLVRDLLTIHQGRQPDDQTLTTEVKRISECPIFQPKQTTLPRAHFPSFVLEHNCFDDALKDVLLNTLSTTFLSYITARQNAAAAADDPMDIDSPKLDQNNWTKHLPPTPFGKAPALISPPFGGGRGGAEDDDGDGDDYDEGVGEDVDDEFEFPPFDPAECFPTDSDFALDILIQHSKDIKRKRSEDGLDERNPKKRRLRGGRRSRKCGKHGERKISRKSRKSQKSQKSRKNQKNRKSRKSRT